MSRFALIALALSVPLAVVQALDVGAYFGDSFYKSLASDEQQALSRHIGDIKRGWVFLHYRELKRVLEYSNHLLHVKLNQAEEQFTRRVSSIPDKDARSFLEKVRGTYIELSLRFDVSKDKARALSAELFQEFEQLNKTVKYLVGKRFPSLVVALKNPQKDEYEDPSSSEQTLKTGDISNYFGDTFYKGLSSDEQDALNRHIDDIKNGWVLLEYRHLKGVLEYAQHLLHVKLNQAEEKFEKRVRSLGNKNASDFLELVRGRYIELSLRSDVNEDKLKDASAKLLQLYEQLGEDAKQQVQLKFPSLVKALKNPPKAESEPDYQPEEIEDRDYSSYGGGEKESDNILLKP